MHFVFPSHPIRSMNVEEMFADQFAGFAEAGFSTSLCPEGVIQENKQLRNIPRGSLVVYRGWMLNTKEYARLAEAIVEASAVPFTSAKGYLEAHHLPRWYPHIEEFTPETRVLDIDADLESELRSIGWEAYFIKDYVKSLKTSRGAILRDPSDIGALVKEMERFRGEIEGGLCVRRVESFLIETEKRYFVIKGKPFSPDEQPVPDIVEQIAQRIASPFFSVDVIRREDGVLRICEIGDGQVSDLVGWSVDAFVRMWKTVGSEM